MKKNIIISVDNGNHGILLPWCEAANNKAATTILQEVAETYGWYAEMHANGVYLGSNAEWLNLEDLATDNRPNEIRWGENW